MASGTKATNDPIHVNRGPMLFINTPTTPERYFLPEAYSAMISGMLQRNRKQSHAMRKAPAPVSPPLWAAILGNRHILPVPTATPRALNIRPNLDENRCPVESSSILFIPNLLIENGEI